MYIYPKKRNQNGWETLCKKHAGPIFLKYHLMVPFKMKGNDGPGIQLRETPCKKSDKQFRSLYPHQQETETRQGNHRKFLWLLAGKPSLLEKNLGRLEGTPCLCNASIPILQQIITKNILCARLCNKRGTQRPKHTCCSTTAVGASGCCSAWRGSGAAMGSGCPCKR